MIVEARVKPNKKRFRVSREGNKLIIEVDEEAREGKANRRIVEWFRKRGLEVTIVKGEKSKRKILQIEGSWEDIERLIEKG